MVGRKVKRYEGRGHRSHEHRREVDPSQVKKRLRSACSCRAWQVEKKLFCAHDETRRLSWCGCITSLPPPWRSRPQPSEGINPRKRMKLQPNHHGMAVDFDSVLADRHHYHVLVGEARFGADSRGSIHKTNLASRARAHRELQVSKAKCAFSRPDAHRQLVQVKTDGWVPKNLHTTFRASNENLHGLRGGRRRRRYRRICPFANGLLEAREDGNVCLIDIKCHSVQGDPHR
mmetsp:Transcript_47344/g.107332  ORF Transcript_47344/g.107332 Transcript_47344/m.107332 type:complete len:231 (-) Transcript_47344:1776-2468(-)